MSYHPTRLSVAASRPLWRRVHDPACPFGDPEYQLWAYIATEGRIRKVRPSDRPLIESGAVHWLYPVDSTVPYYRKGVPDHDIAAV